MAAATMCRWRAQLRADRAQTVAANSVEPPRVPTVVEFPIDDSDPSPTGNVDLGVEMVRAFFADEGGAAW